MKVRGSQFRYTCKYLDIDGEWVDCGVEHQDLFTAKHCSRKVWRLLCFWDFIKIRPGFYKKMRAKGEEDKIMPVKLDPIEKSLL